ncbi:MAG TPA: type II secretion system minor pseudopilin GspK [Aquabacterium sp.]|uniref:type II secretion system minor pseudopilin GspK n=1 Tax=Aquabacterium sp. TaxID=1872578 RepID=UPI002E366B33|nr:type II secretion system minor pseudopilin GspK [Aquabacterium sp.]HEX5354976.1 type II secretion system minor pseudopilin GspK [Aquabacterium sp.]
MNRFTPSLPHRAHQRGAALLMAMVIVTLVATLAASMVWQQWRATQVEGAERIRTQASWVLSGALDWARLILREDAKSTDKSDHLGEPWAIPLAEARLSTFLASDSNNNSADAEDAPEAFLSGKVEDAQAKYNLRRLLASTGDVDPEEVKVLKRLLESLSMSPSLADGIAESLRKSVLAVASLSDPDALNKLGGEQGRAQAPLVPQTFDQILWLGLDAGTLERLRPYVTLLPNNESTVNINTAAKEVIAAVVPGLDLARAARIVQARQRKPFKDDLSGNSGAFTEVVGKVSPDWDVKRLSIRSDYFEVRGRLRFEDNIIEQRHLVERTSGGNDVVVRHQSRFSGLDKAADAGATP